MLTHPEIAQDWHQSNYLIQVTTSNEEELCSLSEQCVYFGLTHVCFYEPDIDNQLTAICIEPSSLSLKLIKKLKLL